MNPMSARKPDTAAAPEPSNLRGRAGLHRLGSDDRTALAMFAVTAVLIFASQWISPNLGSWSTVKAVVVLSTFVMVVGFGQQTVILTGGLDLSVAALVTLGAIIVFSYVGDSPLALMWGVPLVLVITGGIGAVSGLCVALLGIPPFIMTLAMGIILGSAMLGITGGAPRGTGSPLLISLFTRDWLGAPPIVYLMACFVFLASLMQRRTAFGRMLYAIGTSPPAAHIAGLPVKRVTILCYAISGACAGFAGVLMVGFSEGATLNTGDDVLIPSVAAVVVGGTSILGGRGAYIGVVAGALLLTTFSTIISALGFPAGWRSITYGGLILLALITLQPDLRLWSARLRAASRPALFHRGKSTSTRTGGGSK
jgi:ribose transport system permease protein